MKKGAIGPAIIVSAHTNLMKTGTFVEMHGGIAIADLQMKMFGTPCMRVGNELIEQHLADPRSLKIAPNCEQQQFRFSKYDPPQTETRDRIADPRKGQPDARHGENAGTLRSGPCFAEAGIEAIGHHSHHGVEIGDAAGFDANRFRPRHAIGLASGARP